MLDEAVEIGELGENFSLPGVVFLDDPVALKNFAQHDGGALGPLQLLLAGPLQPRGRANLLLAQRIALLDLRLNELDRLGAAYEQLDRLGWIGQLDWHVVLQFWLGATGGVARQCPPRDSAVARTDSLSVAAGARTNRIIRRGVLCDQQTLPFMRVVRDERKENET